jgi:tetratricopeptide (TPR) repeat protein
MKKRDVGISIALVVLIAIVFGGVMTHSTIHYDDPDPRLSLLSTRATPPLVNVLLHAIAAVLLFLTFTYATNETWRSAALAAIWAIHPLRVESVAWTAERNDLLSALFFIAAMLAYVRGRKWLVIAAFVLAVIAKPTAMLLPIALLILDYWPLRRKPTFIDKIPLFIISAAALVFTIINRPHPVFIANTITAFFTYLGKMMVPIHLAVVYPYQTNIDRLTVSACIIVLIAATLGALWWRRDVAAGWLWYLVMLIPAIGLLQFGADRFTYIPSIGIIAAVVWVVADLAPKRVAAAIGALAIALFAVLSFRQVTFWRDSETLFSHALDVTHDNVLAEMFLAGALDEDGRPDEALPHHLAAARLSGGAPLPLAQAGEALLRQQRYDEARQLLQRAVEANPNLAAARENLGRALLGSGHPVEALPQLEAALRLNDGTRAAEIRQAIANAKSGAGKPEEAIAMLSAAPKSAGAYNDLASAYGTKGDTANAERAYRDAIRLDPKLYDARMNFAALLSRLDRNGEALEQLDIATKVQPSSVEPRIYRALVLANMHRRGEAAAIAEEAQGIDAKASNDYLTKALHLQPNESNLAQFIAAMRSQ